MSVIGIDLGGAYSVIAQAKKGGIKTVLNGASQRRSSTLVSISGKERALAANADTMVKSKLQKYSMVHQSFNWTEIRFTRYGERVIAFTIC